MQILYTHDIFSRQRFGGISRYFVELLQHLPGLGPELRVLAGDHINQHLQVLEGHPSVVGRYCARPRPFSLYKHLQNRVQQERQHIHTNQIVHHTYYSFSRPLPRARMVVTIHDLIPERFPNQFGWKARLLSIAKRRSCEFADRILVNSHTTKADLVSMFRIDPDKIDVTHLGNSLRSYAAHMLPNPHPRPYILYVGSRGGYKNCNVLFKAFAQSERLKRDFSLICFGGGSFNTCERLYLCEAGIDQQVIQISGDDRTLASYYRHAAAYVCPSIYEGFGIPAVEAMSFGCPVIASTGGAIPEVVGGAGVYFDPNDSAMLSEVLESVLYNEDLKTRLRGQMENRHRLFRWDATARQTLECYQKAAA